MREWGWVRARAMGLGRMRKASKSQREWGEEMLEIGRSVDWANLWVASHRDLCLVVLVAVVLVLMCCRHGRE